MPELSNPLPDFIEVAERNSFLTKKNIITFLVIAIGLLTIPFSVKLVEQTNVLRTKATGNEIYFLPEDNISCDDVSESNCRTSDTKVKVLLVSPLGPPGTPAPTQPPNLTPIPTATGSTTPTPTAIPGTCPGGVNACGDGGYGLLGSCPGNKGVHDGWVWHDGVTHPKSEENNTDLWCRANAEGNKDFCYTCKQ